MCLYIGIKFCRVVVHILDKDTCISCHAKANKFKISHLGVKHSNFVLKCLIFIIMTPLFLSTV